MGFRVKRRAAIPVILSPWLTLAKPTDATDSYGDGWPDALRLTSRTDQQAFRDWSVWLAGSLWASQPAIPAEVADCAGLLRFCCKEALRAHTAEWMRRVGLKDLPPLGEVRKFNYPHHTLRGALFRVRPGPFQSSDWSNGAFREFADAEHLMRFNTHILGRRLETGRPGDLLFYRQLDSSQPFHSMILDEGHAAYHTGPAAGAKGEIRRPAIAELMRHPEPRWRPLEGNSNFLGVFRWNLLRDPS